MLALYLVCLVSAGALSGVFSYQLLAGEGFIPDFQSGIMIAGGVACAYIAVQLLYVALVRFFLPTRDKTPFFIEGLTQLAALAFLPSILHMHPHWPAAWMARFAPLFYLAAFGAIHVALKFVSFFAFTSGKPAPRWNSLLWLSSSLVCAYMAFTAVQIWGAALDKARPHASTDKSPYRAGDTFADAASVSEGATFDYDLTPSKGLGLTLRWAIPKGTSLDDFDGGDMNVVVYFEGKETTRVADRIRLKPGAWIDESIAPDKIPDGTTHCSIMWSRHKEPAWQRLAGIHPVVLSGRKMMLAGPYRQEVRSDQTAPNIIILAVDGLGESHMSLADYKRKTTPALDRLASTLQFFPNTFTPAPEGPAACMTLLTGLNPLRHGYRDGHYGTLPPTVSTLAERLRNSHYATVAFTEGEADSGEDLVYGTGYERGFELFDASYKAYPAASKASEDTKSSNGPNGSRFTLEKARKWVDRHKDIKFMMFIRLRELSEFHMEPVYPTDFISEDSKPSPEDVYDSALAYFDRQLGSFMKYIRDYETRKNTVVFLVGTHGYSFSSSGRPSVGLNEDVLRVPLILYAPDWKRKDRDDLIGLEDIPVAALHFAGIEPGPLLDGRDFVDGPNGNEPISVFGDPPALSIRTPQWRLSWAPESNVSGSAGGLVELYDMRRYSSSRMPRNVASRFPAVVRRQEARLKAYLKSNQEAPAAKTDATQQ